ncbi:MAG: peptide chain release factor 1 [Betaproteobacteria bacterium AqS2]|uniref:Peptide chain release factor 1 n=1 Tax=Candidatus Amphirhobacter heronislandensis TaxID=1732024 RepID=A0A930XWG9_9GAMM|nr:peptide chain release factor 1 [Betaproteobacteria bacterium AqS2]
MASGVNAKVSERLAKAQRRLEEISALLADAQTAKDSRRLKELYKEHSELAPAVELYGKWQDAQRELREAEELLADEELKEMAAEEVEKATAALAAAEQELLLELQPKDPDDDKNCFLEIRAGAGGQESCIFAGDLLRMYARWCEVNRLKHEVLSSSEGEAGGFKEIIAKIEGKQATALLKHEAGAHRVQRVPETESQGRIHTSVCTVAVMPEVETAEIGINPSELRVDTYRSSGAGGQHVNTTDSAVRITHLPTGIVAESQNDRSQHRNRERAMAMLAARVNDHFRRIKDAEIEDSRRKMVGSGERNEKIRTYNYPQGRVTDHRVGLTVRRLKEILDGDLHAIHQTLRQAERAAQIEGGE